MAKIVKTYVSFNEKKDNESFETLKKFKDIENLSYVSINEKDIEGKNEEEAKKIIKDKMNGSKLFVLLIGENCRNIERIKYEIEVAKELNVKFICINLNGVSKCDSRSPESLFKVFRIYIPLIDKAYKHAVEMFLNEEDYKKLSERYKDSAINLNKEFYNSLFKGKLKA